MRVVTLEEHFTLPDLRDRVPRSAAVADGWGPSLVDQIFRMLLIADRGEARLAEMDRADITMQVLSVLNPGADALEGETAINFAREANDRLADMVARHPARFGGFARLPMSSPDAAVRELDRACRELKLSGVMIHGMSGGKFLDDPAFASVLATAEALDCPIYLHPSPPPRVVFDAYYSGLDDSYMLATGGWGWHSETALHMLRLVLSGTLDRHPGLRFIVGHMGEGLPAMMGRFDRSLGRAVSEGRITRTVSQTLLDQLWITTSGFFDLPCFMAALLTFGPDRLLFSVDYPFASMEQGRAFLDMVPLAPADREKLAHGNADRLLKLSPAAETA
jgi:uncharacterized protein